MKNIMLFLISTSLLVSLVQSKIKCADEIKLDTCYLEGTEGETRVTYVKACGGGKVCTEEEYGNIGICVKPKELRNEDEKCTSPLECRSGICTDNKCAIKKENDACKKDDECGKSAVCKGTEDSKVCKPLSGKNGECTNEYHCQIGLTCSNNKCIEHFSLDVGSVTDDDYACKTGKKQGNKCATYTTVDSKCVSKTTNGTEGIFCKTKTNDGTSDSNIIEQYCEKNILSSVGVMYTI